MAQPALPAEAAGTAPLTVFLILRAFASGCAAMTGTEAISNGVSAFEKPEADNAGKTLIAMAVLLGIMFLGITYLARTVQVMPVEHESVVSQIGRAVFGSGPLYLALQAATALILVLAANTAFADFPRLSSILSRDGYAPRQLANLGDRLVFSNGIGALAFLAALLIVIFGGRTHSLIPLYAVGVFLSFTLSQAGMVRHWQKTREGRWRTKAAINGVGAVAYGARPARGDREQVHPRRLDYSRPHPAAGHDVSRCQLSLPRHAGASDAEERGHTRRGALGRATTA